MEHPFGHLQGAGQELRRWGQWWGRGGVGEEGEGAPWGRAGSFPRKTAPTSHVAGLSLHAPLPAAVLSTPGGQEGQGGQWPGSEEG